MEAVVADRRVRANEDVERQLTNDVDDRIGSDAVSKRGEGSYSFLSCVYEWRTMIALFS